jgi:predicted small metal-binding protein
VISTAAPDNTDEGWTMAEKKVTCDCGKTMRGASDEELVSIVQKHAKDVHNMTLTVDQVLAMAEPT